MFYNIFNKIGLKINEEIKDRIYVGWIFVR